MRLMRFLAATYLYMLNLGLKFILKIGGGIENNPDLLCFQKEHAGNKAKNRFAIQQMVRKLLQKSDKKLNKGSVVVKIE